ncbi:uncharacterized protein MONOS_17261 [Monocercomonoides exilis]|uniref:uncharacterized protein n=1 Tax=Monocercomonoides exilis TaxID=2049356 RepID=UPI003559D610|nr:hypothetical protein MONOS_17261 [Monocercomonoides exilis]
MDEAVSRVSKEKAKKYLNVESIWSDATKQKHSWVNRLLTIWAEKVEIEPWPLHHEAARGFVLFCGKECHYPLSSIRYVIIPSLKRINIIKRGKRLSSNTYHSLKDAVRCLKYSSEVEKTVTKKEPAVLQDVKRIVHFIPNTMLDKALESSLFLVAVHTGARAITLSSVKLSDIKQVVRSKFTNKLLCTIQFNRTKASHNWGHKVTIEGNEDEENDEDPVYWLSLYVYQKTGIRLSDWNNAKEKANLNQLVWPLSTDSMRERFKSRAEAAGYPRHLFCFHSLRSGFICTALIAANKDNETQRAVMEKTAFVAGWQQCRLSQCTYIKEAVKRAMVASRLITTNDDRNQTVFDETLLELEVFHGVSFKENVKKEKTPMEKFSELVKRRMSEYYGELIVEEAKRERYIRNGSKKLVEENEELMMVAEYRMKEINEKKEEEQRKTDLYSVASTVANMFIQDQLLVQGKTPEEMATMICDMAESCTSKAPVRKYNHKVDHMSHLTVKERRKKEREEAIKDRERNEKNNIRRIRWKKEDDDKLIQLFNEGKRASEMMKLFPFRNRQHIDDHLQVLLKKGKIEKPKPLPLKDIIEKAKQSQTNEIKKKTYKKRKPVNMEDEWGCGEEKATKRKRREEEEEEEEIDEAETEMMIKKMKSTKKSKRLKRSEDGSEWVRVEDDSDEDVQCL